MKRKNINIGKNLIQSPSGLFLYKFLRDSIKNNDFIKVKSNLEKYLTSESKSASSSKFDLNSVFFGEYGLNDRTNKDLLRNLLTINESDNLFQMKSKLEIINLLMLGNISTVCDFDLALKSQSQIISHGLDNDNLITNNNRLNHQKRIEEKIAKSNQDNEFEKKFKDNFTALNPCFKSDHLNDKNSALIEILAEILSKKAFKNIYGEKFYNEILNIIENYYSHDKVSKKTDMAKKVFDQVFYKYSFSDNHLSKLKKIYQLIDDKTQLRVMGSYLVDFDQYYARSFKESCYGIINNIEKHKESKHFYKLPSENKNTFDELIDILKQDDCRLFNILIIESACAARKVGGVSRLGVEDNFKNELKERLKPYIPNIEHHLLSLYTILAEASYNFQVQSSSRGFYLTSVSEASSKLDSSNIEVKKIGFTTDKITLEAINILANELKINDNVRNEAQNKLKNSNFSPINSQIFADKVFLGSPNRSLEDDKHIQQINQYTLSSTFLHIDLESDNSSNSENDNKGFFSFFKKRSNLFSSELKKENKNIGLDGISSSFATNSFPLEPGRGVKLPTGDPIIDASLTYNPSR